MDTHHIIEQFNESADLKLQSASLLAQPIAEAIALMFAALANGNRILACGNGAASAECQRFAAALVGRFERERLALPVMALASETATLTAVGDDYGFKEVFARQVQAFGQSGDVLLVISASGNSANVIAAVEAALERDMRVVALSGKTGGVLASLLNDADVLICVGHDRSVRVQEIHNLIIHCLCDGIDVALFGGDAE